MFREYFLNVRTSNFQIQFFKQLYKFKSYRHLGLVVKLREVLDLFYCLMEEQEGGSPINHISRGRRSSGSVLKLFQKETNVSHSLRSGISPIAQEWSTLKDSKKEFCHDMGIGQHWATLGNIGQHNGRVQKRSKDVS